MRGRLLRFEECWGRVAFIFVATLFVAGSFFMAGSAAALAEEIDFRPAREPIEFPPDLERGAFSGIGVDSRKNIYLLQRVKPPVLCFDAAGKFVRAWGEDLIGYGHGLTVDADDNVWVTCTAHHMVYKFNVQGKLLLALGKLDRAGPANEQFDQPTYAAVGPRGDVYVTDGYGNSRLVHYLPSGKFVETWGKAGKGPLEFKSPHCAVVDAKGRLLVCDRDNERIQVLDAQGGLLATWTGFKPYSVALDGDGRIFVGDGDNERILLLDDDGKTVKTWGKGATGSAGEIKVAPHLLAVDREGNLLAAEGGFKRLVKLERVR